MNSEVQYAFADCVRGLTTEGAENAETSALSVSSAVKNDPPLRDDGGR